jgi:hypothetical protein
MLQLLVVMEALDRRRVFDVANGVEFQVIHLAVLATILYLQVLIAE